MRWSSRLGQSAAVAHPRSSHRPMMKRHSCAAWARRPWRSRARHRANFGRPCAACWPGCGARVTPWCGRRVRVCSRAWIGYSSETHAGKSLVARGRGSVGRASPCQGEGRGFESRRPLGGRPRPLGRFRRLVRSFGSMGRSSIEMPPAAEWPSGLGKGLQSPVRGFDSRLRLAITQGRLAQWESATLTR